MDSSSAAIPLLFSTLSVDTLKLTEMLRDNSGVFILLVLLILCSAFFSGSETVLTCANRIRLKTLADNGDKRAKKAIAVTEKFDKALTTILVGNTLVNIAAASVATLFAKNMWGTKYVPAATAVITVLVILFGEILPKTIAKVNADKLALGFSSFLLFIMRILTPVTIIFTGISKAANKLFGVHEELTVTEDELYDIIETMEEEGSLLDDESKLIYSAFEFGDVTVSDVYTDKSDIQMLNICDDNETIAARIRETKHSRLPVYSGNINNIIGVIGIRKYLRSYLADPLTTDMAKLMDKPFFVKPDVKIDSLLSEMSSKKIHMGIVKDDKGLVLGLVTVEDLLEELVGEIWDEDDNVDEKFRKIGGNRFEVSADLSVVSVFELIDYDNFDREECGHETIGKWLTENLGDFPLRTGVRVEYRDIIVSVSRIAMGKIKSVIVRKKPSAVVHDEQKNDDM